MLKCFPALVLALKQWANLRRDFLASLPQFCYVMDLRAVGPKMNLLQNTHPQVQGYLWRESSPKDWTLNKRVCCWEDLLGKASFPVSQDLVRLERTVIIFHGKNVHLAAWAPLYVVRFILAQSCQASSTALARNAFGESRARRESKRLGAYLYLIWIMK